MTPLIVAFITGLTTGGLSCLAVQGGLLASSLAHQMEQDMKEASAEASAFKPRIALPIILFLTAKLVAYTFLGFALGALGSLIQLTPLSRAVLQIAIGVFMVGNALRMFNVHPIFRYFNFEPPQSVTRAIRRLSKKGTDTFTPLLLGLMTVLIPCGVTQAMMAVALGSGSAAFGAALMFAFTLGTTPVFFALAYFATRLGARMEKIFMRAVAVVLLVLGFVSVEAGLNLMGSPYSLSNLSRSLFPGAAPVAALAQSAPLPAAGQEEYSGGMSCCLSGGINEPAAPQAPAVQPAEGEKPAPDSAANGAITLRAENNGYYPQTLHAPAGTALVLNVVTENTQSCSRAFVIPGLNVQVILPETGTTPIEIPAQAPGTTMRFACSMGMYTGEILFE